MDDDRVADADAAEAELVSRLAHIWLATGQVPKEHVDTLNLIAERPLILMNRCKHFLHQSTAALGVDDLDAARRDLDRAMTLLADHRLSTDVSGVQTTTADACKLEARLATAQGDWCAARRAWEGAVANQRRVCDFWQPDDWESSDKLADILAEFSTAAEAAGDAHLAEALRDQCRDIRSRRVAGAAV
jgi:hypothetical protein